MDIQNISLVIVSLINLFWGLVILSQRPAQKPNIVFSVVVFSVVAWAFIIVVYRNVTQDEQALFFSRLLYVSAIFIPLFFLFFTFLFPHEKRFWNKLSIFFICLPAIIVFFLTLFTDLILVDVKVIVDGENIIIFGRWFFIYALYISGYFGWTLLNLFLGILKNSGVVRNQLIYIFVGLFASSNIAMTTNLFMPWFGNFDFNWFGQVSTVIWISFISFAIVRYHLMNIKVITTQIFAIIISSITLTDVFSAQSALDLVARLSIFLITAIFAVLLIILVLREVKRREQMEILTKDLQKVTKNLKKANNKLKRLEQAKLEFLSIASHQLRTPLTVIKGYVSMMLEGNFGPIPKLIKENLNKIYLANERLISLVESLLNISRIEAGRLEFDIKSTNLEEIIKSLITDFKVKAAKKNLKLIFLPEKDVPLALVDTQKTKEVITYLIDNAIKYTTQGDITLSLSQDNQSVVFSCQDTGRGISAPDLPSLFNRFVQKNKTATALTESTGLSLYFSKMVIENMGGRIWVESAGVNYGSKFSFSVPRADQSQVKKAKIKN